MERSVNKMKCLFEIVSEVQAIGEKKEEADVIG